MNFSVLVYFETMQRSKNSQNYCFCFYIYTSYRKIVLAYLDILLFFLIIEIFQNIITLNLRPSHSKVHLDNCIVLKLFVLLVVFHCFQDWLQIVLFFFYCLQINQVGPDIDFNFIGNKICFL